MPRSANQKLKLLTLLDILRRETDEDHPIAVPTLIDALEARGISAERKSIYADVAALQDLGYDIVLEKGRGYYLASREFELAELKLLVDAVQSSKFISEAKSRKLIDQLKGLCSRHEATQLQRQVYVAGRVKTMNEGVLYIIDALHDAITANRMVTFRYFDYNEKKEKVFRHEGKTYVVSPVGLLRNEESYYLVAWEGERRRRYRVDRMSNLTVTDQPRRPGCADTDMAAYTRVHFNMFSGQETNVRLRCPNELAHVVLDRFGMDIMLIPDGEGFFTFTTPVVVSPQFFGWLFGLGPEVEILSPGEVREDYARQLEAIYLRHK